MPQVLAISFRPKRFSELVGQEKLVKRIRGYFQQKRVPTAWMFMGQKGAGKTTIARILAMSMQCRHQELVGEPCDECYAKKSSFNIFNIPAAKFTGKKELEAMLSGSDLNPNPGSLRRVYILDELHKASDSAQSLLLEYFEDCPRTTVWMSCTSKPEKILEALVSRCTGKFTVPGLDEAGVRTLVKVALTKVRSELDSSELSDALLEANVTSPRLIVNAVEAYTSGASPEEAARVEVSTDFDVNALFRCVRTGDWGKTAKHLREATAEDARGIRSYLAKSMTNILLDETGFSQRTRTLADGISALTRIYGDDSLALSATAATLYDLCRKFAEYRR